MIYVTHFLILNSELLSTIEIWNQIHVDHGTEWAVMLFTQNASYKIYSRIIDRLFF